VEAERIARALLEASSEFALSRPPELFCGDAREPGKPPREYGNTCTPQLWSSAAMFTCVSSILGLEADLPHKTLRVAPVKTPLWNRIEISGLHFLGQRIDFAVDGGEVRAGRLPAGIHVEAGPPDPISR
jgi:glycogen debranching enzyme